ncbi:probable inactive 1-aminocyclopropane-1-carboxylate synthase-like protein 2 [Echinops telfairi]|uniref:Probable inactive 1-aminocyclopropane-1-carboxylate synthase-like protein 2 n=1 Tax=Echinops telfairi TaxID=9371 RepID=A0ABM0IV52_ECHTE|nr:probable inactive 1-aminocyclopropane-1-carboxylate synthase-like protein 2 [Echinops telfairi]
MSADKQSGDSQPAKGHDTEILSLSSWTNLLPRLIRERGQDFSVQVGIHQLLEMLKILEELRKWQSTVEDSTLQLIRHRDTGVEVAGSKLETCACTITEQKGIVIYLLNQLLEILQSGSWRDLESQLLPPFVKTRGAGAPGQGARSSRQPDQLLSPVGAAPAAGITHFLSQRGKEISNLYHSRFIDYNAYHADKYHEKENHLGFINLMTSENKLCFDLMSQRLSDDDMNYLDEGLLEYADWKGQPFLRKVVAQFLTHYCKAPTPLDPENVVVLNGCSPIFSALAMVLCDVGEAFLIPTPSYSGFAFSSHVYSQIELVAVPLDSQITRENTEPFQLTVAKLEQALQDARLKGKKVRGLVLTNPQNPLGDIYSQDSLKTYLEFAKRHNLHVIVDEIYMLSVFDDATTFHSVLSLSSLPDPSRTHVIWGTSKDFGICGFRFGSLYSHNKEVVAAVGSLGYLHSLSGLTQYKLYRLLHNREWIDNVYHPTNCSRLRDAHKFVTDELKALDIPFLSRCSGLYVWINLEKYLHPCTFEEEQILHRHFVRNKVLLSPGQSFMCKEPGWFRLVFADKRPRLETAMHRFRASLKERKEWLMVALLKAAVVEEVAVPAPPPASREFSSSRELKG